MSTSITVHCLVRNEENWVWYAINSILNYVDKILVFDTGSTDKTASVVKSIKSSKIIFEEKGEVDKKNYAVLRQEMLIRTKTDWFLILDGDEVWPAKTMRELINKLERASQTKDAVIVPLWLCSGDVFHYDLYWSKHTNYTHTQKMKSYMQARVIRKSKELSVVGEYGYESYVDKQDQNISYWSKKRLIFLKEKYWHMSYLPRSNSALSDLAVMQRSLKTRYVLGAPFSPKTHYPDVFYLKRPTIVPSPWRKYTWRDSLKGLYFRPRNFIVRKITN